MKNDYAGETDSFTLFSQEMIKADPDAKESTDDINRAYRAFCSLNDYIPMEPREWSKLLKRSFPCKKAVMTHPDRGTQIRGYKGVRLRKKAHELADGAAAIAGASLETIQECFAERSLSDESDDEIQNG